MLDFPTRKGAEINISMTPTEFIDCMARAKGMIATKIRRAANLILGLYDGRIDSYFKNPSHTKKGKYAIDQQVAMDLFKVLNQHDKEQRILEEFEYDYETKNFKSTHLDANVEIIFQSATDTSAYKKFMKSRTFQEMNTRAGKFLCFYLIDMFKTHALKIVGIVEEVAM